MPHKFRTGKKTASLSLYFFILFLLFSPDQFALKWQHEHFTWIFQVLPHSVSTSQSHIKQMRSHLRDWQVSPKPLSLSLSSWVVKEYKECHPIIHLVWNNENPLIPTPHKKNIFLKSLVPSFQSHFNIFSVLVHLSGCFQKISARLLWEEAVGGKVNCKQVKVN